MISRYSRPEMKKIWSEEHRFRQMLEVEILAAEALPEFGGAAPDRCLLARG